MKKSMRITNKAKRIFTLHFGEEKTNQIIKEAVVSFNRLDSKKVEEILHLTNFYSSFWEDCDYSIPTIDEDFNYMYNLLTYELPKENTTINFSIFNGKTKITEIKGGA